MAGTQAVALTKDSRQKPDKAFGHTAHALVCCLACALGTRSCNSSRNGSLFVVDCDRCCRSLGCLQAFAAQAFRALGIPQTCMFGLICRPGGPSGGRTNIHQRNAVDRANRHAQRTTGAVRGNHGMHELVGTQNGVGRAGIDAQRAANAPVFVDARQSARRLAAVDWVQRAQRLPRDMRQPGNAFGPPRRALVNAGRTRSNGLGITGAVRVPAPRALGLRQGGINARCQALWARGFCYVQAQNQNLRVPRPRCAARAVGCAAVTVVLAKLTSVTGAKLAAAAAPVAAVASDVALIEAF